MAYLPSCPLSFAIAAADFTKPSLKPSNWSFSK